MFIEMNRFWRRSVIAAAYRIPPGQEGVIETVPTAHTDEVTGEEYVLEHDVDRAIAAAFPTARPDGPYPPDTIRVGGNDYAGLSGQRWRLIQCLWGRGAVLIDAVIEEIWGYGFDDADKAFDSLVKHTRRWLRAAGCPLAIRTKTGYAQLLSNIGKRG